MGSLEVGSSGALDASGREERDRMANGIQMAVFKLLIPDVGFEQNDSPEETRIFLHWQDHYSEKFRKMLSTSTGDRWKVEWAKDPSMNNQVVARMVLEDLGYPDPPSNDPMGSHMS